MIPQESKHELAVGKEDGEQDFPAFSSLNGIHLNDGSVRISGHVSKTKPERRQLCPMLRQENKQTLKSRKQKKKT